MAISNISPSDPNKLYDPDHWRGKAVEARAKADEMGDDKARETMKNAARQYDQLVTMAEKLCTARES